VEPIKITLKMKPVTLNHTERSAIIRGKHMRFPSKKYKVFKGECDAVLRAYSNDFKRMAYAFDPRGHFFIINYVFYTPELIAKSGKNKGKISRRSMDLSNLEKPLEDQIFKQFQRYNSEIDDCQTCSVTKRKVFGSEFKIDIEISLGDL